MKELAQALPLSPQVIDTTQALTMAHNATPTGLEYPTLCHTIANALQALTTQANGSGLPMPHKGLKDCG